jgi:class 3 adenylate cyclase/tetratricopeptide (TPR) repeat protein
MLVAVANCPKCGEDNPERARFCLACGTDLAAARRSAEERRLVSILFVDLVGFTARAHAADPEDVWAVLRPYYALLRDEIERYGGTVEKFIGDAVMAVFGAPVAHEDDPERAVRAALRITQAIEEFNDSHPGIELAVRAAVATGEAVVALGVHPDTGEGMVTGDVVNTASRLQEVAPVGGVVVGEVTYRSTRRAIVYEVRRPVILKGKPEPVPHWRALEARSRLGIDVSIGATTPFVGRNPELNLLDGTFARALRESSVQLVTVTGEPGVGKTRLLSEFAALVDAREDIVLWRQGRSLPYGDGITFWALGEIIKAHCGILESDTPDEALDKVARAVASVIDDPSEREWFTARIGPLVGVGSFGTVEPSSRAESFTAWRRFLQAIATQRPLVVVFEDLHWADGALLEFIDHVVEEAAGVPLFVVCAARSEFYDAHPSWGTGRPNATKVALSPLGDDDTARLLSALLSDAELPSDIHDALLERAGGNPLYAQEFVRMLFDQGILRRRDGGMTVVDASSIPVPESVQALIAARLDTLSREEKSLIADAAVAGKVFWDGVLFAVAERDPDTVSAGLANVANKELVRVMPQSSVSKNIEYSFGHALIRDVAYNQIPRAARGQKHYAVAKWIESVAGDRVADRAELLVHHYEKALAFARASSDVSPSEELIEATRRFTLLAGDRVQNLDVARALSYYERSLELLEPDDQRRPDVLLQIAITAASLGDFDDALRRYEEALAAFIETDRTARAAYAMLQLARLVWERGDTEHANTIAENAVHLLEQEPPGPELASAYADKAWQAVIDGRSKEGLDAAVRALALAEQLGHDEEFIRALSARGMARCDLGDERGIDDLRTALAKGLETGVAHTTAVVYSNLAEAIGWSEGPAAALRLFDEAEEFCTLRGMVDAAQWARVSSLEVLFELGRWDELLRAADGVLEWTDARGGSYGDAWALAAKATVLVYRGDSGTARVVAQELLPKGRALRDPQAVGPALVTAALIEESSGDQTSAVTLIEELEETARRWPVWWRAQFVPEAVRIAASARRVDLAERLVSGLTPTFPREHHAHVTTTAAIAEARGQLDRAAELYAAAADAWADFGFVLERGLALLGRGRCLARTGRADSGAVKAAREVFVELGAPPLLAEAESWLEAGASRVSRPVGE